MPERGIMPAARCARQNSGVLFCLARPAGPGERESGGKEPGLVEDEGRCMLDPLNITPPYFIGKAVQQQ
jgi:hypothetical protein